MLSQSGPLLVNMNTSYHLSPHPHCHIVTSSLATLREIISRSTIHSSPSATSRSQTPHSRPRNRHLQSDGAFKEKKTERCHETACRKRQNHSRSAGGLRIYIWRRQSKLDAVCYLGQHARAHRKQFVENTENTATSPTPQFRNDRRRRALLFLTRKSF